MLVEVKSKKIKKELQAVWQLKRLPASEVAAVEYENNKIQIQNTNTNNQIHILLQIQKPLPEYEVAADVYEIKYK